MHKKFLFLITALTLCLQSFTQTDRKGKLYERLYYNELTYETDDYRLQFTNIVATEAYVKYKMKIFNKTDDYIVAKPIEIIYIGDTIAHSNEDLHKITWKGPSNKGNIIETIHNERGFVIPPHKEEDKIMDYKGTRFRVAQFRVDVNGIYRVLVDGTIINVENFVLPPVKNEVTIGNMKLKLLSHRLETKESVAKFECSYDGESVLVVNQHRSSAITSNGTEVAISSRFKNPFTLEKGQKDIFTVAFEKLPDSGDMLELKIKWNDTFRESKLSKMNPSTINIELNEKLTKEKNE